MIDFQGQKDKTNGFSLYSWLNQSSRLNNSKLNFKLEYIVRIYQYENLLRCVFLFWKTQYHVKLSIIQTLYKTILQHDKSDPVKREATLLY